MAMSVPCYLCLGITKTQTFPHKRWACLTLERVMASLSTNSSFMVGLQFADRPAPPPLTHTKQKGTYISKTYGTWDFDGLAQTNTGDFLLTVSSVLMLTDTITHHGNARIQAPRTHYHQACLPEPPMQNPSIFSPWPSGR